MNIPKTVVYMLAMYSIARIRMLLIRIYSQEIQRPTIYDHIVLLPPVLIIKV